MTTHTDPMDHPPTDLTKPVDERTEQAGRTPLVIKLLVAATFVVILNETIMINAIPRLMTDFHIDARAAQWLSTVFMLTMAAVIPVTGWFLQRVSTRTAYAVAMATFSAGTALAAVAPTFEVLLAARVVQAGGTAVMMPLLMTTLMTVVPESDRGRVMGQVTLAMSCAPALGPAVSGVILHFGSWRLIFAFVLPIAVLVGIAGMRQLENVGETESTPVSWLSVALAAGGFGSLVYGLSEIGTGGWTGPVLTVLAGVLLIAAFAAYQVRLQQREMPLLDLRTLGHRTYAVSLLLMTAAFMAFLGSMILLPLYLQDLRGLSELQTGLLVMPGGLAMGLLGPQVGKIYDRVGARPLVIPGSIGIVIALAALSRISSTTPYPVIVAIHMALMACLAAVFTPVFTVGLGDLPEHLYSHGSSLLGTLQQVAGAIGTAALIVVMSNRTAQLTEAGASQPEAFVGGLQWAFVAAALIGVVVVAAALLLPSRVHGAATSGH
ncbi:Drug resistance transporter, EmrB/QacA subfamily OS=Tsukamurella paurometabola (strain ATCC 8368 /DSM / CCUG 35730 / CIP 100753 / JCM 10117 / KCTC 9821/ NBRC 16120 / NCIMB 702349 / NCTC 13040) OX=521096 GN=Tpau_3099 PE=4 SV=1 [Tsukamurella paurometabola]|uniref:Drug resistance transporter, EmrB/QacA subfamily n=1 Tax=Tsukamurella paurometabola (strain ATCC 8368 / DSM 20162 / CCUG 35730 / CIP 100753 / JCM 10117 / KCTC 9821 / NBRC 16120 / NCIMB 702349 / NCTC 13040) TaxID=521096 RepID=D5UUX1_TSUPD|nr:MDR family MFS transporter [Tsukamurella paurometabola]ADG79689.1 drug resistance transporter, EmrB/QacA subfamily [Tsukamurella paurometabola DSM 20162]SUP36775.1 Multidrug resistance protein B [Tsukamurella paurometabola]